MDTRGTVRRHDRAGSRLVGALAAALMTASLTAACGGDEPEAAVTAPADSAREGSESVVITISDFSYQVPETIEPGATVTVRNEDGVGHTVTSDEEGVFDVAVGPGAEVSFTVPEEAGEYPFHCTPHPQMTSTLVVG